MKKTTIKPNENETSYEKLSKKKEIQNLVHLFFASKSIKSKKTSIPVRAFKVLANTPKMIKFDIVIGKPKKSQLKITI